MGFAENLNYCMQQRGYSAYRLAKELGVNNQSTVNWQRGGILPHPKTRQKIADHFGIKKDAFLEEVKKFNGFVKAGEDKDFGRILSFNNGLTVSQGPFYGIECCPKIHHTMGGVRIDTKTHALRADGTVIEGLYCAGEVVGGIHGGNRLGGNAIVDFCVFGRLAGQTAATE